MTNDYGNLELHKVLLSAMKDIDKICRENNLKYYLHAGTLLGAINHKGFIPWDDDVDISMPRKDYEQFAKIIERDYNDIYFMRNYENDCTYPNNRAKVCIKGTEIKHFHEADFCEYNNIFVDIIPLYYFPKSKFLQKVQRRIIEVVDAILNIKLQGAIPTSIISRWILYPLSKLSRKFYGKLLDNIMIKWQDRDSGFMGTLCYVTASPFTGLNGYENDKASIQGYENPIYIPFEDTEFMTISNWHDDLVWRYGPHYMDPYPEEKRVTKHDIKEYYISDEVRKRIGI